MGDQNLCDYHSSNGVDLTHPDMADWAHRLVSTKMIEDPEDRFLQWEAAYDKFVDCDACTHEQLMCISAIAAALIPDDHPHAANIRRSVVQAAPAHPPS